MGQRPTARTGKQAAAKPAGRSRRPEAAAGEMRRKLVALDAETWRAVDLLGRDTFMSFQELTDEAFRDLLRKHGRPVELREQLKRSAQKADREVDAAAGAGKTKPRRAP